MPTLDIREVTSYQEFVDVWDANTDQVRLFWQLLGQLDEDEVLIRIPAWLAEEKTAFGTGSSPTEIVGRIDRETDKAIRLSDSVAANAIAKGAHLIHHLEREDGNPDRTEWVENRLADHRRTFQARYDKPGLADDWLPKSQIQQVVRRG